MSFKLSRLKVHNLSGREGGLAPAVSHLLLLVFSILYFFPSHSLAQISPTTPRTTPEYLWYEAENTRGFATKPTGEPMQNPSWMNLPRAKAPGWGINGPGVSAEWSQG